MSNLNEFHLLRSIRPARFLKLEDKLTNEVAMMLKIATLNGEFNGIFFHVPNEVVTEKTRDIMRLAKKKYMGMIPGAPDFVLVTKNRTLFVELKTAHGRQTDSQKMFQKWCEKHKLTYLVIRDALEFKQYLISNGIFVSNPVCAQ